jgi:hypothetical protein
MIVSFRDAETSKLFEKRRSRRFANIANVALRNWINWRLQRLSTISVFPRRIAWSCLRGTARVSIVSASTISSACVFSGGTMVLTKWRLSTIANLFFEGI